MGCLPSHGRVNCSRCFAGQELEFDKTRREASDGRWRITWSPLAWGNTRPEVIVLGFSKGPTQRRALTSFHHDEIAFKGGRKAVGQILSHVGLVEPPIDGNYGSLAKRLIAEQAGRFHFGSFIRCTVERYDEEEREWKGSGAGMLDKYVATQFGEEVTRNCVSQFLRGIPDSVRLVVLFGLGRDLNYVREARRILKSVRGGRWRTINDVAYTDGRVTFVHVEHFKVQGAHLKNWLGENVHSRSRWGEQARDAVASALYG